MLSDDSWDNVGALVSAEDFYRNDHRLIFAAIQQLAERREPRDAVTVSEYLQHRNELVDAGGLQYLGMLVKDTPSVANIQTYADIVRERALLRELIAVGNGIAARAFRPEGRSGTDLVDAAEQAVYKIAEKGARGRREFVPLEAVCSEMLDRLDTLHQEGSDITGLSTGFKRFDELTQGLQNGDLIILAGRPSMGKTTLALNIAENAAFRVNDPVAVAVFSMEMSTEQLALRFVSSLGRVQQGHLRNGNFSDDDWPRITTALQQMSQAPVYIDDTPGMSPSDLRSRARRLKRQHDIGLIIVDYLQLMQVPGTAENRTTEISNISRALKSLARELEVPVIALSQLNRSVEQRPDRRPVMSDLRESGAIEQDADLIVFIYRDEVYNKETEKKGQADVIIAKHRNGETGDLPLTFLGKFSRFENFQREFEIPPDIGF
ncbi:MAG: replicative DNA helicase, partial [Gammaproteobacteria bacterium]|jgi:replicative DNA helicase|nr:replicative DNA helicase [Gammaproteobacteria bacterium]